MNISDRNQKEPEPSRSLHKNLLHHLYGEERKDVPEQAVRQTIQVNSTDRSFGMERKEEARQANYRIVREVQKGRYEPKVKTALGSRNKSIEPNGFILNRASAKNKNKVEKTESSKQSDSSHNRSFSELAFEGSIKVNSAHHLNELEKQIHHLWEHYQLLTKILLTLKEGNRQEKNTIVKYVEDICSDRF